MALWGQTQFKKLWLIQQCPGASRHMHSGLTSPLNRRTATWKDTVEVGPEQTVPMLPALDHAMFTRGTCSISESSPVLRRSHCAPRNLKIMPPGTDSPILPPSCYADPRAARLPWCPRNTRCLWRRPTIQVRMP